MNRRMISLLLVVGSMPVAFANPRPTRAGRAAAIEIEITKATSAHARAAELRLDGSAFRHSRLQLRLRPGRLPLLVGFEGTRPSRTYEVVGRATGSWAGLRLQLEKRNADPQTAILHLEPDVQAIVGEFARQSAHVFLSSKGKGYHFALSETRLFVADPPSDDDMRQTLAKVVERSKRVKTPADLSRAILHSPGEKLDGPRPGVVWHGGGGSLAFYPRLEAEPPRAMITTLWSGEKLRLTTTLGDEVSVSGREVPLE